MRHCHRLLISVVFKARLDGALSNLFYWKVSVPILGGLEWGMIFKVTSSPNHSVILWKHNSTWCKAIRERCVDGHFVSKHDAGALLHIGDEGDMHHFHNWLPNVNVISLTLRHCTYLLGYNKGEPTGEKNRNHSITNKVLKIPYCQIGWKRACTEGWHGKSHHH